ncbi:MAG: 30S ribosomal protein S8 [Nitrospinota bacterium]|nr:30S ribosomal protein S8 [Nitrospinota bacterium]
MVTDPIADMLTRIRNAMMAGHDKVDIPSSNMLVNIAEILRKEGYINDYKVVKDHKQGTLKIFIKWIRPKEAAIKGIRRISTPGRRTYTKAKDLPKVLRGLGIAIISTNKGILTDHEARQQNCGGEILCYVW